MIVTLHRGSNEIGGNCVEIRSDGHRILLDAGLPLSAEASLKNADEFVPKSLSLEDGCDGLIFSHAHLDHFGLTPMLKQNWPLWAGRGTATLMRITLANNRIRERLTINTFKPGVPFRPRHNSPFRITAYTVDHSAYDSHMFAIEAEGRQILYTGDFRMSGYKAEATRSLIDRMSGMEPDALIVEGTMAGGRKSEFTEPELLTEIQRVIAGTKGNVFVLCSTQNIDRLVTIYKASRKNRADMLADLPTGFILDYIGSINKSIPHVPEFSNLKILMSTDEPQKYHSNPGMTIFAGKIQQRCVQQTETFAEEYAKKKAVAVIHQHSMNELKKSGYKISSDDALIYSMWSGYKTEKNLASMLSYFESAGAKIHTLHAGGHASIDDIRYLVEKVAPKSIIPIHTEAADEFKNFLPNQKIIIPRDGEELPLH